MKKLTLLLLLLPLTVLAIQITVPQANHTGDMLRGNANGTYSPVATSTFNWFSLTDFKNGLLAGYNSIFGNTTTTNLAITGIINSYLATNNLGQVIATTTPSVIHNLLNGLQGGDGTNYFHSNQAINSTSSPTFLNLIISNIATATDVVIPAQSITGSTYKSLNDNFSLLNSAGRLTGGEISSIDGTHFSVAAGNGLIRIADDDVSQLKHFSWTASSTITIPEGTTQYVGVEYNGGSPRITTRTSFSWNKDTEWSLGRVINDESTELHIISNPWWVGDSMTNVIERFRAEGRIKRDDDGGGLILSQTGTRNIAVSAGTLWSNLNEFPISAIDTSVSGTVEYYWYNGVAGIWNDSDVTQYSVTQWNDTTKATLQPISNSKFVNIWVYAEADDIKISLIYPQNQYNTAAEAETMQQPAILPEHIRQNGILVGRIIAKQGVDTPISVESAFGTAFTNSVATDHGNLTGLTDDDHPQYWNDARGNAYIGASTTIPKTYTANSFSLLQSFVNILSTGLSSFNNITATSSVITNSTTTNATTTRLAITGITNSFLATNSLGQVIATATPIITEVDPIYALASSTLVRYGASTTNWNNAYNIVNASSSKWDTAYNWGNHALAGYLTNLLGGLNAILGNATTTNLAITGIHDSILSTNSLGQVVATTTPTSGEPLYTQASSSLLRYGTTSDALTEGATNLFYKDSRVNSFIAGSSTIPKTFLSNSWSAIQNFTGLTNSGNATTTNLTVTGTSTLGNTILTGKTLAVESGIVDYDNSIIRVGTLPGLRFMFSDDGIQSYLATSSFDVYGLPLLTANNQWTGNNYFNYAKLGYTSQIGNTNDHLTVNEFTIDTGALAGTKFPLISSTLESGGNSINGPLIFNNSAIIVEDPTAATYPILRLGAYSDIKVSNLMSSLLEYATDTKKMIFQIGDDDTLNMSLENLDLGGGLTFPTLTGNDLVGALGIKNSLAIIEGATEPSLIMGAKDAGSTNNLAIMSFSTTTSSLNFNNASSYNFDNSVSIQSDSPQTNHAVCYLSGNVLGHCTSAVGSGGTCTCASN